VPYKPEGPYFVRLDEPAPPSRSTPTGRDADWAGSARGPVPAHKRRKRKLRIRPVWIVALAVFGWLGWAYTTPGGPSARVRSWIDNTRSDIATASVNPDIHENAAYFNSLYEAQGSYPDLSDSAVQTTPGFSISEQFVWCGPRAVVLQSASPAGALSRLLLDGKDLGNAPAARGCPANLSNPAPWKLPK
jgi:hypothetical protein